ncbi:MAG: hypothetical protein JWM80_4320 [Cyanobacteria bacterium RYN_339]|nr:hypothetical protein [Cyanobacteria bacterium RYN_339]
MDRRITLLGCLAIALMGCAPTIVSQAAADAALAPAAQPAAAMAPEIANLDVPSRHVIGTELFEARYDVARRGSGQLRSYGLRSRLGEKVYPIPKPIPVIDHGHVAMAAIGPLPNLTAGGDLDVEFWVVDSAGLESNHLTFKMVVQ